MPNYAELLGQVCNTFTSALSNLPIIGPFFSPILSSLCELIVGLFTQFFPTPG